jgi:hypothetical protein
MFSIVSVLANGQMVTAERPRLKSVRENSRRASNSSYAVASGLAQIGLEQARNVDELD